MSSSAEQRLTRCLDRLHEQMLRLAHDVERNDDPAPGTYPSALGDLLGSVTTRLIQMAAILGTARADLADLRHTPCDACATTPCEEDGGCAVCQPADDADVVRELEEA